uniref:non-specific serine/threonine protein kinase n=1 Tax=Strigamia maritima TaxID=126957 RepID=T1J9T1_STRMM
MAQRVLVVSSRARNLFQIQSAVLKNVILVEYKYDTSTLDGILAKIAVKVGLQKVDSLAFVMHGTEEELCICSVEERVLSVKSIIDQTPIREFFSLVAANHINTSARSCRIDFLATYFDFSNSVRLVKELERLIRIPIGISHNLAGSNIKITTQIKDKHREISVGELYFDISKIRAATPKLTAPRPRTYNKDAYEKIRTVGKGAFGTAVLYRRVEDDTMVVIKEINMHDLTASERQLALNEIRVLSLLNHTNITTYLNSFEDDGVLKIEMEYADGGTLAQFLQQSEQQLDEREILIYLHQIVSALRHMHDHNILHRDLKTANIFLTKEGIIKVGDFGISKMMTTKSKVANTVVGTPYYISPEMCEGKSYDEKSDVWALGCILYEMACLQKTFEGSNLPALVNKIMKGQFAPVKGNYSHGLKQLIRDLLQRDPEFRPTAAEILQHRLPELFAQYSENLSCEVDAEMLRSIEQVRQREKSGCALKNMRNYRNLISKFGDINRSVVYHIRTFEDCISLSPIPLPPRSKILQLAVSNTHMIALTSELLVYTWGDGKRGQLGHGTLESYRVRPEAVAILKTKSITKVCAGDGFSVFASNSGIVMTCGDGTAGCLGQGDWNCTSKPKLIEKLLSVDVSAIACGFAHVVVLSGDGEVYSWGRGAGGRLGLGHEDDCCIPTQVSVPNEDIIRNTDVYKKLVLTHVKSLNDYQVVDISMAPNHTALLVEPGHMVECGETFTIVGTLENVIYFWGTRYIMCAPTRPPTQDMTRAFISSANGRMEQNDDLDKTTNNLFTSLKDNTSRSLQTGSYNPDHLTGNSLPHSIVNFGPRMKDVLLQPQEILALYASPAQINKGETVNLSSIRCQGQNIYLIIDTTAPLPNHAQRVVSNDRGKEVSSPVENERLLDFAATVSNGRYTPDMDTVGPVPDWLKQELENSEVLLSANPNDGRRNKLNSANKNRATTVFVQTKPAWELKQELEKLRQSKEEVELRLSEMKEEFEEKQLELEQQAEIKIKDRELSLSEEIAKLQQELIHQMKLSKENEQEMEQLQEQLNEHHGLTRSRSCAIQ